MTDEIVYSASEVYKRLGISASTLRKYMEVLSREGFAVKKNIVADANTQSVTLW